MGSSIVFLLGCWTGCIAGFLLAGLLSRTKTEEAVGSYGRLGTQAVSGNLSDQVRRPPEFFANWNDEADVPAGNA